jgi:hypothetical protein
MRIIDFHVARLESCHWLDSPSFYGEDIMSLLLRSPFFRKKLFNVGYRTLSMMARERSKLRAVTPRRLASVLFLKGQ